MRRRDLIATTAVAVAGAGVLPTDQATAAHGMADTIEDVLFGQVFEDLIPGNQLAAQLAARTSAPPATASSPAACRGCSPMPPPAAMPPT
jgi:hypothetical protein